MSLYLDSLISTPVFVRTVTMFFVGNLKEYDKDFLILSDASWIGDTGYLNDFLRTGKPRESEIHPTSVLISRASLIDISAFQHPLPEANIGRSGS